MRQKQVKNIGVILLITGVVLAVLLLLVQTGVIKLKRDTAVQPITKTPVLFISYPLNNSLFPPEIAAPTFKWSVNLAGINNWRVNLSTLGHEIYSAYLFEPRWRPDSLVWVQIKRDAGFVPINCSITCQIDSGSSGQLLTDTIRFQFSHDSVAAPLFFRQIDLPFKNTSEHLSSIEWRLGDISHYSRAKTLLTGVNMCGNCHSFSADGKVMGIDFDYLNDKGGYATVDVAHIAKIGKENFYSWGNLSNKGNASSGFLSALSPDGRYVATTTNDYTISSFYENEFRFFPVKGVLGIYDRYTGESYGLPGASDTLFVQCNPVWSPDGETIIFARSPVLSRKELNDPTIVRELADGKKEIKFDLYRIPFNQGKGGMAEPIKGASSNNKSNYFARVSPDGKWIVFTQAQAFMLRQLDSKLVIIPFEGGEPHELECNLGTMNSWHTWSPNSKWIAFSTKGFSPYTKIALAHIDAIGNASPPVLLENFIADTKAVNLPEFVNIAFKDWQSIELDFLKPVVITGIDLKRVADGRYQGKAILNGSKLKQVTATLVIVVADGKITIINIEESQNLDEKGQDVLQKVVQLQTLDIMQLGVNTIDEMVLMKAVEDGLMKGMRGH